MDWACLPWQPSTTSIWASSLCKGWSGGSGPRSVCGVQNTRSILTVPMETPWHPWGWWSWHPHDIQKDSYGHVESINCLNIVSKVTALLNPQDLLMCIFGEHVFGELWSWFKIKETHQRSLWVSRDRVQWFQYHGLPFVKREETTGNQPTEVVCTSLEAGTMNSNSTISSCWTSRTRCWKVVSVGLVVDNDLA